jgi:type IV fimbrial biogenesis protein FimT
VAIILLAVGMPMFSGIVANNRATSQANALMSAMKLARSEAVKRATEVSVCAIEWPEEDTDPPPATCDDENDWEKGWVVYEGDDRNLDWEAPGVNVIRAWDELREAAVVKADVSVIASQVTFDAEGASNDSFAFETDYTGGSGTDSERAKRCIRVMNTGQVRVVRPKMDGSWSCEAP